MPARLVEAFEAIDVKQLVLLIYGQGGSRKTSIAQTAEKPFTLAFDGGIYRAFGRKACMFFDTWGDVVTFDQDAELVRHSNGGVPNRFTDPKDQERYLRAIQYYVEARTIIVDTVGLCLDRMSEVIMSENTRNGNPMGGLSLQGFGALKNRFKQWSAPWRSRGQDVVLTCHQKENKKGDQSYFAPDIVGGSLNTILDHADAVGYMTFDGGHRTIDFYPNDRYFAKTPPCGWTRFKLPDFAKEPEFLAKLIAQAKESMGRISGESARLAQIVEEWRAKIEATPSAQALTELLPVLASAGVPEQCKRPIWVLATDRAKRAGWQFDGAGKRFTGPDAPAAAPPPPPPAPSEPAAPAADMPREPGIEEPEEQEQPQEAPKKQRSKKGAA